MAVILIVSSAGAVNSARNTSGDSTLALIGGLPFTKNRLIAGVPAESWNPAPLTTALRLCGPARNISTLSILNLSLSGGFLPNIMLDALSVVFGMWFM